VVLEIGLGPTVEPQTKRVALLLHFALLHEGTRNVRQTQQTLSLLLH
jgi:hypothetical protein